MIKYLKKEKVLSIALILAIWSAFLVHPDQQYIEYIDLRVLALLFCLMLIVKGFQDIGLFAVLVRKVFGYIRNTRSLAMVMMLACFLFSMLITNDVALITFVPFAIMALHLCHQERLMIRVVVLQTLAANLGSMLTPIGSPQNLYLYSASGMGIGQFVLTVLPIWVVSFVMLIGGTMVTIPKEPIVVSLKVEKHTEQPVLKLKKNVEGNGSLQISEVRSATDAVVEDKEDVWLSNIGKMNRVHLFVYFGLFIINLLVVLHVLHWAPAMAITVVGVLVLRKWQLLKQVDYALLLTFVGFFIFVGNVGRIELVSQLIANLLVGREILISAVFSQFLSNVPAALLLSGFTENLEGLLVGCNIGGLGTLIASMASLISYKFYANESCADKRKYIRTFTLANIVMFVVLIVFSLLVY